MVFEGETLVGVLRDISQGVRFLHSSDPQIIHGDLKSANVLVDSKFRAKVADFGFAGKSALGTGTPYWMAPELLRRESKNTPATDVYSFGIILYEVYARREPYDDDDGSSKDILAQIADRAMQKRPPFPRNMTDSVRLLMKDCLGDDPTERPSFEEIDSRLKRINHEAQEAAQAAAKRNVSLTDVFPKHIADKLARGETVEAEHKDCVTIFFSDIVGFTTISSALEPRKVANMLDRFYHALDKLSHKHDVFKVGKSCLVYSTVGGPKSAESIYPLVSHFPWSYPLLPSCRNHWGRIHGRHQLGKRSEC